MLCVRKYVRAKRSNRSKGQKVGVPKLLKDGAGDGTRTRDVQLGKLAFYH